jgi:hypothetical protein
VQCGSLAATGPQNVRLRPGIEGTGEEEQGCTCEQYLFGSLGARGGEPHPRLPRRKSCWGGEACTEQLPWETSARGDIPPPRWHTYTHCHRVRNGCSRPRRPVAPGNFCFVLACEAGRCATRGVIRAVATSCRRELLRTQTARGGAEVNRAGRTRRVRDVEPAGLSGGTIIL